MSALDSFIRRSRLPILITTLLFIVYCQIYFWQALPNNRGFESIWLPDTAWRVATVQRNHPVAELLQPNDVILAIDGRGLRRTEPIFLPPIKLTYDLTIQRGDAIEKVTISIANTKPILAPVVTAIAFIGWIVGALLALYSKQEDNNAIRLGILFAFNAAVIAGIFGSIFGVPYLWIMGHLGVHFAGLSFFLIGLMPRSEPFSKAMLRFVQGWLILACLLAVAALCEVVFLFPDNHSLQDWLGFSLTRFGYRLFTLGLVLGLIAIFARIRLQTSPYRQQQAIILAFCVAVGLLPLTLFVLIPQQFFGFVVLPSVIGFALTLFVPLGYFFIIYRQGYLSLDQYIGRFITFILTFLTMFLIYAAITEFLRVRGVALTSAQQALSLMPALFLAITSRSPIENLVQFIFYGNDGVNAKTLAHVSDELAQHPERQTVQTVIHNTADQLQVCDFALYLRAADGHFECVTSSQSEQDIMAFEVFDSPIYRSGNHALFKQLAWAYVLLPLRLANSQTGFLAFSEPNTGHLTQNQMIYLEKLAKVIAFGNPAVELFEASHQRAIEDLQMREQERIRIASEIHDDPLQTVIVTANLLKTAMRAPDHQPLTAQALSNLETVSNDLRQICSTLHPPVLKEGLAVASRQAARKVRERSGIPITLNYATDEFFFDDITLDVTTAYYYILLEALNNSIKHANPSEITVTLSAADGQVSMTVEDDGTSQHVIITQPSLSELARQSKQFGLINMHRWALGIGATLTISQNEKGGVVVHLSIPSERAL